LRCGWGGVDIGCAFKETAAELTRGDAQVASGPLAGGEDEGFPVAMDVVAEGDDAHGTMGGAWHG